MGVREKNPQQWLNLNFVSCRVVYLTTRVFQEGLPTCTKLRAWEVSTISFLYGIWWKGGWGLNLYRSNNFPSFFSALFSGMAPTLIRDVPFSGIYLMFYTKFKAMINESRSTIYIKLHKCLLIIIYPSQSCIT